MYHITYCSHRLSLVADRDKPFVTTADDHRQGKGTTLSSMHPDSSRCNACKDYIANTSFHRMSRFDSSCSRYGGWLCLREDLVQNGRLEKFLTAKKN